MIWRDRKGRRFECAWNYFDGEIASITVQAAQGTLILRHGSLSDLIGKREIPAEQHMVEGTGGVIVFSERYVEGLTTLIAEKITHEGWKKHLLHLCDAVLRGRIYGEHIYRALGFVEGVLMALGGVSERDLRRLEHSTSPKKAGK